MNQIGWDTAQIEQWTSSLEQFANHDDDGAFEPRVLSMLRYSKKLTIDAAKIVEGDIIAMRNAGLDDGEILDVNQVTAYFAYANRVADGLGINLEFFHKMSTDTA